MESRKMALVNLFSGQQWKNRHRRERTCGHRGRSSSSFSLPKAMRTSRGRLGTVTTAGKTQP